MLQEFSKGYYLKTYWIRLTDNAKSAEINHSEYEVLKENEYKDVPIVMKFNNNHFSVTGNQNISSHTLEVSKDFISDKVGRRNPFKKSVFIAKPATVQNLYIV